MNYFSYDREILYKEIWAEPVKAVAARYGISDVALGKICRKMAIPLPGRGYWAKVKAGKETKKLPLPPLSAGVPPVISSYGSSNQKQAGEPSLETAAIVKTEKRAQMKIKVSSELSEPPELVSSAKGLLEGRKPRGGLVSCRSRSCLDIVVSPEQLDRALRVMDALLKAAEARGLQVKVTPVPRSKTEGTDKETGQAEKGTGTCVLVEGKWIPFGLSEELDVIRYPDPDPPAHLADWQHYYWIRDHRKAPDEVPSGRLALRIKTENLGVRRTWRDAQIQRVEECLNAFVAHLYLTAEAIKEERAAAERRRLEAIEERRLWAIEQKRREREERRREVEERRRKDFADQLQRWREAQEVRAYLAEARAEVDKLEFSPDDARNLRRWLAWLGRYAERLDPHSRLPRVASKWVKAKEEPVRRW